MRRGWTILVLCFLLVAGCSDVHAPNAKPTTGRVPQVADIPDADETVRGAEEPAIVTLPLGSRLKEKRLTKTEELSSNIIVPTTNLTAVPVTAALQAVLSGTDVSLSWEAGTFEDRLVTVANLSGPLPRVVEKICTSAKVFCSHRGGLLELKEQETFVIELPAMPVKGNASGSAANTMADTISELSGQKAQIDHQGGNLLYTTTVDGHEKVTEYLTQLRHGRPLVVIQLYIWEVTLNSDNATGINWKSFSIPKIGGNYENVVLTGSTAFTSLTSPGVSLGAKLSGKVDAEAVLQFLSSQGQVQTISNPQLTFVSGSNAEFRVGGERRYISQVGQLTTGSVSGSNSTSTGIGTNTVSTDSLETGLTVDVGGSFESGVISAVLEMTMQDVVSLNPTTTESGVTIDLPETSERKVQTSIRVRPGDNLVLAGLVSSRDTNDRSGIPTPFGRIPSFSRDQLKNSEMVILVKPSIVLFADTPEPTPVLQKESKPIVDAVIIDKDGARKIHIPDSPVPAEGQPVAKKKKTGSNAPLSLLLDSSPSTEPELMVREPVDPNLSSIPVGPSPDGAPVDKRLMQRGFSRAFDEMLAPSPVSERGTP